MAKSGNNNVGRGGWERLKLGRSMRTGVEESAVREEPGLVKAASVERPPPIQ